MEFEWDDNKNKANLEKHGIDFEQAKELFTDDTRIEKDDDRKDYGELRKKTIGRALDLILSVIYTVRGAVIRLISARAASRKERTEYFNNQNENGN